MENEVVRLLTETNQTITTMESCTGGCVINRITNVEGSSKVTHGGYVTYSNEQKVRVGVPKETIDQFGVYSKQTAIAMAETAKQITGADVAIGVTGTLSNVDDSNPDSVQGEVYFAVIHEVITRTKKITVPVMQRDQQKQLIADQIFEVVLRVLNGFV